MPVPSKFDMSDTTPIQPEGGVPAKFDMSDATPIADALTPSLWQRMKNNFNSNTQGAKPGEAAIPAALENFGAGGGDFLRSLKHPIKTAEGMVNNNFGAPADTGVLGAAEVLGGPVVRSMVSTLKSLHNQPARTLGNIGTGAIMGEAVAPMIGAAADAVPKVADAMGGVADSAGAKLSETSDKMMAGLIGAGRRGALGPKATFQAAVDVGKVVNDSIDGGLTLKQIADKIDTSKETLNQATDKILNSVPETSMIDAHSLFDTNAAKATEATLHEGVHKATYELRSELESQYPKQISAKDAIDLRRKLLKEVDPATGDRIWPAGTKGFRLKLYHDLNSELAGQMPPEQAAEFRANNYKVSRLIKAESALDKKRLYGINHSPLGSAKSMVGAAARTATGGTPGRMVVLKSLKKVGDSLQRDTTRVPPPPQ